MHYLIVGEYGSELIEADSKEHARKLVPFGVPHRYYGFNEGDRCFNYYDGKWGTVTKRGEIQEILSQGTPTGEYDCWLNVKHDDGTTSLLNEGGTHPMGWDWGRIIPPHVAKRFGYGDDPKADKTPATYKDRADFANPS